MASATITHPNAGFSIPGYAIVEQLYGSARIAVYRAVDTALQRSVVIKALQCEFPSFSELAQFRNQYAIAKKLTIPGVVCPYSLEPYGNGYALVMEDFGGVSLDNYARRQALEPPIELAIALQMADILQGLSRHRVAHKDIKPANILIHPDSKEIQLIDFSIASLLPKESQEIQNPNVLEGALAYLAPEQTGRMNRGIDYRADFYSLGVTLYELLTGTLPFTSEDPLELVYCHIAKSPAPPHHINPAVPPMLSAIVLKLMAKNAEDRYQSALGLKHDLQQCLSQWRYIDAIPEFELGRRDVSDRFLIPEKLYGREQEVQTLLAAFERISGAPTENPKSKIQNPKSINCFSANPKSKILSGAERSHALRAINPKSELMLVAGFSGIGKTAVINEVHKPITRRHGYFIKGKFDQFNRNIPFSAFVQAFRGLMGQLLGESNAELTNWRSKILQALGENGQVIVDVIPELECIIGPQSSVPELSGAGGQNRFNLLFGKFVQVFTTKERPLVVFLDDLQWADSASLTLLKLLMEESDAGYLLVLGAYRDNEVFPAHPLMTAVDEIQKQGAHIHTLTLAPLSKVDVTQLVADTLLCGTEVATPLSQLIYQKTQGNPFFTTQFLRGLYEDGYIVFEANAGHWQCNLSQVRSLVLTDDVATFMVERLQKLPQATQTVLQLAACIGARFDLATLAVVCEGSQESIATDLWQGLQEGFVIPENETYKFFQGNVPEEKRGAEVSVSYRFLHDRVQQAAYTLISEDQKQATHLKIGRQLWRTYSDSEQDNHLFNLVNHLNTGHSLILDRRERDRIAQLNLQASQKARASVAYEASRRYCYAGQQFLHEESWQENYDLRFALAIATIEAEYFNHNLEVAQQLSRETLGRVQTLRDRIAVHELQILFEINQNRMNAAISLALDVLNLLDVTIPSDPPRIQAEINSLRREIALPTEKIADLATLPGIEDDEKLAVMRILTNASSAAYIANPTVYPAIVLHTVQHCMKYGHSALAASAYSWYGALLCGVYDEIEAGYQFGKLSLTLLEKFNARALAAKVSNMFNVFIRPWKERLANSVDALPEAIQTGFDNGDVEYAFYAAVHYCNYLFYSGRPLKQVRQAQDCYLPAIVKAQYDFHAGFLQINQQVVANLLGETDEPQFLQGVFLDGQTCLSQWLENNLVFLALCFYEAQTRLAYLFEDNIKAVEAGEHGWRYRQAAMGTLYVSEHNFYYSLALLAKDALTAEDRDRVVANQSQLKTWSAFSSANFQHKYDLVEAEWHRRQGEKTEAIDRYDLAIARAKQNGYLQEEALANELAAKFFLAWGKEKVAACYLQEAYYCYARWGAKAKVAQLEQQYSQLLIAILQFPEAQPSSAPTLPGAITNASVAQAIWLDFGAVMKAAQAISQEIELEKLLTILMQIALSNAGAESGHFMLQRDNQWGVAAQAIPTQVNPLDISLDQYPNVPRGLIYSVARTGKTAVFENLVTVERYAGDGYVIAHQPKSVLCTPVSRQGQLIGILYLENNLTVGAFTRDRIEVLQLLMSQAAISIENARLYQQTENYSQILEAEVKRKTQALHQKAQDLEQTLKQLKQTQAQLIQAEKMSSLGQLVAGIAHEINNPASFIMGNIDHLQVYVGEMMDLLTLYQKEYPQPSSVIQVKSEDIELDFVMEDVNKILNSMAVGSDRISQIVLSLRNFARLDESDVKSVDIHSGIESTLLILQNRLNASDQQAPIRVVSEYGDLPMITCCPGQLNQVFLNIFNNAIDAIRDQAGDEETHQIRICTDVIDQGRVRIAIANTGRPIPETIQTRIFEPFFTTKSVGQGTGIGLFVSYSIIQQHGGELTVRSNPGEDTEFE
ncbi:MAG: AAA family ATPase, partial [Leptolyngbyaceae cyanobacterium MO_188.B28]|nr:AAA family ATPase [Leptolyngbyaceae cyanobacterium MO_188.B28]